MKAKNLGQRLITWGLLNSLLTVFSVMHYTQHYTRQVLQFENLLYFAAFMILVSCDEKLICSVHDHAQIFPVRTKIQGLFLSHSAYRLAILLLWNSTMYRVPSSHRQPSGQSEL